MHLREIHMLFCVAALTCAALKATGLVANIYPSGVTNVGDKVSLECNSETGPRYNKTLYCAYDRKTRTFRLLGDKPHCPGTLLCTPCCKLCSLSLMFVGSVSVNRLTFTALIPRR